MGKALYRKYRSKSFDEVVGQEHITDTLKNALKKGAISHAYLFTGPRGVGKTSVARILAHAINDLEYNEEATHLDIIEIDAASNRRIDEIRELRDKVHIAPTSTKYKVYIIDEVHMLTREAFNALLKTLEEPPAHAVFILATTEAHKVPETIVSRTQRFSFKPIDTAKTVAHLRSIAEKEGLKISDEALTLLADHGRGSFRDSISMLDQLAGLAREQVELDDVRLLLGVPSRELITSAVDAVTAGDITAIFTAVRNMREAGIDSGRAAGAISEVLRTHLVNDSSPIEHDQAIRLLKNLLDLTLTSNDFIGLELALLDGLKPTSTNLSIPPSPSVIAKTSKAADLPKTELPKPAPVKLKEPQEPTKKPTRTDQKQSAEKNHKSDPKPFTQEAWNTLLGEVKKHHNTLYGVLRMAQVQEEDDGITLTFGFGFHKKQVDSPRNTGIIREFVRQHFGIDTVRTVLDSKKADAVPTSSTPSPQKSNDTEAIASVSNIFGGAELL